YKLFNIGILKFSLNIFIQLLKFYIYSAHFKPPMPFHTNNTNQYQSHSIKMICSTSLFIIPTMAFILKKSSYPFIKSFKNIYKHIIVKSYLTLFLYYILYHKLISFLMY